MICIEQRAPTIKQL